MRTKFVSFLSLAFMAVFSSSASAAITLTDFGNSGAGSFTVDSISTSFGTASQGGSSITLGGIEGNQLTGGIDGGVSIVGQASVLRLLGATTAAPTSAFTLTLYDEEGDTAFYSGGAWTQLNTGGTLLNLVTTVGAFNFGNVIGLDLNSGGISGASIGATLTRLETIPEPSRMVLVAIGISGLLLRRRRSVEA
jgi:hypothetical protein